ncbi:GDSL esterase/lipase At5g55050-like isoform X2 [Glycine soja]|uniref:GDSL esterase/lipase isoform B n=1 Tax=Glycine soja TaxID=3848 RepID=A0A445H0E1_GLYSO|nr:GDSL esterase/lipase At5g55050-like isoform X2 [Glycine soja]RZB67064.1 GDSL esterase/lipase isoform B [Glycine soja]
MGKRAFLIVHAFFVLFSFGSSKAEMVSAVYVFGDSLVDVGNNNYLTLSIAKANHRHYGVDFPTHKPTGRFSNGKNAADFVAEKLGFPTSPPYLSLITSKANKNNASFMDGVSFASAGAGIFDGTDERYRQSIPLRKQMDYYSIVHEEMTREVGGAAGLQKHLSKSIFVVVIGSNDIFGYFESSDLRKKSTPQQYVDSMAFSLKVQLQRLYDHGARKFEIAGVGTLGCCPDFRLKNKTECFIEANYMAVKYNEGLQSMLKEWQSENGGIIYSYFDTFAAINDLIQTPASYGFSEQRGNKRRSNDSNRATPEEEIEKAADMNTGVQTAKPKRRITRPAYLRDYA